MVDGARPSLGGYLDAIFLTDKTRHWPEPSFSPEPLLSEEEASMDPEIVDLAEDIQDRIVKLRDSL